MYNNYSHFNSVTHVIFDLAGLMIDSEMWLFQNLNRILKNYGKNCSLDAFSRQVGNGPSERLHSVIDEFELKCDPKQFYDQWFEECIKDADNLKLMPGIERLTKHLHRHNIPLAVSSTARKSEFFISSKHLKKFFEDGKYFNHITHADEVEHLKPHPEMFQVCASKFSPVPDPQNVLVFDDTILGVSAAISAGMQCVLVWDNRFDGTAKSNATLVINSLEEFKPEWFGLPPFENTTNLLESNDYFYYY